jgi:hypothetical protein
LGPQNTLHTDPENTPFRRQQSPRISVGVALYWKNTVMGVWYSESFFMFFLKVVFSYEYSNLYSLLRIAADIKESLPNFYTTVSCEDVGGYHPVKIARPYACVLNNLVNCPFNSSVLFFHLERTFTVKRS